MNILPAENDKNLGTVLEKELEGDQHAVGLVLNGVEALASFLASLSGLVALDIRIPRLIGAEAPRIVRRINPQVPIITSMSEWSGFKSPFLPLLPIGAIVFFMTRLSP